MVAQAQERTTEMVERQSWHALASGEAVTRIASDAVGGLSSRDAKERLARHGANALPEAASRSLLSVVLGQFRSPLIYLLFGAAGIALASGHVSDSLVIFTVVLLNTVIGALQEGRAERSLEALRKIGNPQARVVRDGKEQLVATRELVVGDVIVLDAGDAVPADARLLDGAALQLGEAALTGESVPVFKTLGPVQEQAPLAERSSMLYAGTHLTSGRARALVVATGANTEIGHIAALAAGAEQPPTPLERRVAQFGRYVIIAAGVLLVVVNAIGLLRGIPLGQVLMIGISQVVGMIPEGLPVAMTIALAIGVQRMARRRAVVRKLSAVETLGSTTVICSDKTGTLTRNEMMVTSLYLPTGRQLSITGEGYAPEGELQEDGQRLAWDSVPALREVIEALILCSDAELSGPHETEPRWKPIGDPTEVALVALANKSGFRADELRKRYPREAEIPFDSDNKLMATQHQGADGARLYIKGAPEVLLAMCGSYREEGRVVPLDEARQRSLRAAADAMAEQALRVLAVGYVEGGAIDQNRSFEAFRGKVTILALIGQLDPPRGEVKDAVTLCHEAGISVVMVTGDHKVTGHAVARALGIARESDAAVDGAELEAMSDAELAARVQDIRVFARVHPAQKLRIVDAFQQHGHVVAMTGDGVNDAPALVKADVGLAMGITGTEVAKESAKIVIGDDNFATIVAAVEEGRIVYRNIKKVVLYLFSTSIAAVIVLLTALIAGYQPPLAAVQILWINLVTEGTVTVNLIMEPAEGDEMKLPPIPRNEPLLTRVLLSRVVVLGLTIAACTLGWFVYRIETGHSFPEVQTETFTMLAVCAWFNVLNCRSERRSVFGMSLRKNPWLVVGLVASILLQVVVIYFQPLARVFHTVPFSPGEALALGAVASLVLWVEEIRKLFARRRYTPPSAALFSNG